MLSYQTVLRPLIHHIFSVMKHLEREKIEKKCKMAWTPRNRIHVAGATLMIFDTYPIPTKRIGRVHAAPLDLLGASGRQHTFTKFFKTELTMRRGQHIANFSNSAAEKSPTGPFPSNTPYRMVKLLPFPPVKFKIGRRIKSPTDI